VIYATSKLAAARLARRHTASPAEAGAVIALTAVAPGVIRTPMTQALLETEAGRAAVGSWRTDPTTDPLAPPLPPALLDWLTSPENSCVTGQVVFVVGGAESDAVNTSRASRARCAGREPRRHEVQALLPGDALADHSTVLHDDRRSVDGESADK